MSRIKNKKGKSSQIPLFISKLIEMLEVYLFLLRILKSYLLSDGLTRKIVLISKVSQGSLKMSSPYILNIETSPPLSANSICMASGKFAIQMDKTYIKIKTSKREVNNC